MRALLEENSTKVAQKSLPGIETFDTKFRLYGCGILGR
jgi:hypothetical protein